ncbi:hypothetical protein J6590_095289 [Homalodisca vitripennis]|nr:hypothetical protein J6590_095289 [Homalodisca vitripennis]
MRTGVVGGGEGRGRRSKIFQSKSAVMLQTSTCREGEVEGNNLRGGSRRVGGGRGYMIIEVGGRFKTTGTHQILGYFLVGDFRPRGGVRMQETVQVLEPEHAGHVGLPAQHPGRLYLLQFLAIGGPDVLDLVLDVQHREARQVHGSHEPLVGLVTRRLVLVRGRTEVPQTLVLAVVPDETQDHLVVEHGQRGHVVREWRHDSGGGCPLGPPRLGFVSLRVLSGPRTLAGSIDSARARTQLTLSLPY